MGIVIKAQNDWGTSGLKSQCVANCHFSRFFMYFARLSCLLAKFITSVYSSIPEPGLSSKVRFSEAREKS